MICDGDEDDCDDHKNMVQNSTMPLYFVCPLCEAKKFPWGK